MNQSALCLDDAEAQELLSGDMALERTSELEEHLTACIDCREKLEHQVGDEGWWCDTQSSLRAGMLSEQPSGNDEDSPERLLELLGPTDDPNMLGRIGTYEIIGLLGQGGMGAVFKGYDRSLNRFVAIKMLLPHLAASGAARKRFAREGQAAAAVVDDHVMAIHCVDEWQGVPYLVMTYSRGVSLQRRLQENGTLEVREILRIGMQAAKGLAAAHSQGIVHRDIKPANFFLDDNVERVQLMDFGLARAVDDASLTRSGMLAGTPQYMSPEQARAETVDHRSDLFSLGSVLYVMCVGHAPFRADTSYGVLRLISDTQPRPIRETNAEIPEWLCVTIGKLMSKHPSERFDSAAEVADVLKDCLAHTQHPTTTPLPQSVVALLPRRASRPPWLNFVSAAAAFILICLAGVILLEMGKGTIRIETNSATDIPIRIIQGDTVARELMISKDGATTRLRAGKYRIEVDGDESHFEISGDRVTLKRGKTWIATIDVRSERERSSTEESRASDELTAIAAAAEKTTKAKDFEKAPNKSDRLHPVFAPNDGVVIEIKVEFLDTVAKGDVLLRLRSEEGEFDIRSEIDGVVASRDLNTNLPNRPVRAGEVLLEIANRTAGAAGKEADTLGRSRAEKTRQRTEEVIRRMAEQVSSLRMQQRNDEAQVVQQQMNELLYELDQDHKKIFELTRLAVDARIAGNHDDANRFASESELLLLALQQRYGIEPKHPQDAPAAKKVSDTIVPHLDLPSDTQVHVVGCLGPVNHQPIEVFVKSTGKPMVVVMCCAEVANWNWNVDPEADVRGVILSGYDIQQFSHSAPKKSVPTIIKTYAPIWKGITNSEKEERSRNWFYCYSPLKEEDFQKTLDRVTEMTGRNMTSFQGIVRAKEFIIDGKRGVEELEIAKRWLAFAPGADKQSEEFIVMHYKLDDLFDDERPTPAKQLAEKMDAFNIPRLSDDRWNH